MNESYFEWFEYAVFPVIMTDSCGIIRYKNRAAGRYLPMLRRGASVLRHLYGRSLSAGTAYVIGDTPYPRALIFNALDGNGFLLLFLSRLQYGDGEALAEALHERFHEDFSLFYSDRMNIADLESGHPEKILADRTYADLISLFGKEDADADIALYDMYDFLLKISVRLKGAFRALGYRIQLNISEEIRECRYAKLNIHDFLFVFGRFLYLFMKLSDNSVIDISVIPDRESEYYTFRFATRTSISRRRIQNKETLPFLASLIPECATELALFEKRDLLAKYTDITVDQYGRFLLKYRLSCAGHSSSLHVCSIDFSETDFDALILPFIRMLSRRLRDYPV